MKGSLSCPDRHPVGHRDPAVTEVSWPPGVLGGQGIGLCTILAMGGRAGPAGGTTLAPCGSVPRGLRLRGGCGGGKREPQRVLRLLAGSRQAMFSGVHPVAYSGVIALSVLLPSQATDPPTSPQGSQENEPRKVRLPAMPEPVPAAGANHQCARKTARLLSADSAEAVSSPRANQAPTNFTAGLYSGDAFPDSLRSY